MLFRFEAEALHLLDLTNGTVRNRLRLSLQRLIECNWRIDPTLAPQGALVNEALTQAVGREAARLGIPAMRVRSARVSRRDNLVIFPRNLPNPEILRVWHPEAL